MSAAQRRIYQAALKLFAEKDASVVSVSELATAARVARGTIYNNLDSIESLFVHVASHVCVEMSERVARATALEQDPAIRFSAGLRHYLLRAQKEPNWARFILRHALTTETLKELWTGPPMRDIQAGIDAARFKISPSQIPAAIASLAGAVLGGFVLLLDGHGTGENIGSDIAELTLRGLGVPAAHAQKIARVKLAPFRRSTEDPLRDSWMDAKFT